jgi:hypothetical protein
MECTRLADWYERRGEDPGGPEWADVVAHAQSCPDCSLVSRRRRELR